MSDYKVELFGIDIDELFYPELEVAYELISKNTDYLKNIPIEDVKDIQFSIRKDIIILLKNGILLFNGEKRLDDIKAIAFVDTLEIFSISNDNVVTCLTGKNDYKKSYINDNNYQYKKVIQDGVGIYLLTYENTVKFFGTFIKDVINYSNFYDVDDIGFVRENYDIVVIKKGKVYSLFMNHDYSNEPPEVIVEGKLDEIVII